jgi:hypothetical protein
MKYFRFFVLLGCISIFVLYSFGLGSNRGFDESVVNAFRDGNSSQLSKYFFENVDVKLMGKEEIYSKAQAEAPSGFQIQDYGSKKSSNYAIAKLKTKKGNFNVMMRIKGIDSAFYLQSLNIEVDDDRASKS